MSFVSWAEVRVRLPDAVDDIRIDAFWDEFIPAATEQANLMCGGGCGQTWDVCVTRSGPASATAEDRAGVEAWLRRHPLVSALHVGPLVDAWQ